MTKNDLKLIGAFIDTKNVKDECNYANLRDDGIYATDTRKMIHFNIPMLHLDKYVHKKILSGFASVMKNDDSVSINHEGYAIISNGIKMKCDNFPDKDVNPISFDKILNQDFEYKISLEDISDLHFELTQKNCFVDDVHLLPVIEYADCKRYEIFYNKQKVEADKTNTGIVKIIGIHSTEDEVEVVKFNAVILGREFKTQAHEQLLIDL